MKAYLFLRILIFFVFNASIWAEEAFREIEAKILFENTDKSEIFNKVRESILELEEQGRLTYLKLVGAQAQFDAKLFEEVFYDIYYDGAEYQLLEANHSLRLRYRYKDLQSYRLHKYLPFLKIYQPLRCEIQLKGPYKKMGDEFLMETGELRFENRRDILETQTLPPPWPKVQMEKIIHGFENPFALQIKNVSHLEPVNLESKLQLLTMRQRGHVETQGINPWGSGPNPRQILIISLDECFTPGNSQQKRLELEIQIDRNTYRRIRETLHSSEDQIVRQFAVTAEKALLKDLQSIVSLFVKKISHLNPKSSGFKYQDLVER